MSRITSFPHFTLALAGVLAFGCESPGDQEPAADPATSLYALVETIDGTSFYPPLGPAVEVTGPFDASLLDTMEVILEATLGGDTRTVATFDASSSPALRLITAHEVYFLNVPAATYFTNPEESYRFRVRAAGVELGFSDLDGRIFALLLTNPSFVVGLKLRVEARPVPVLSSISPATAEVGADALSLTVTGSGFSAETIVRFAGVDLETTFLSATTLVATIPATSLNDEGTFDVTTFTPAPGGGSSGAASFEVVSGERIRSVDLLDFLTTEEGGLFASYQITDLAVDWERDRAYFVRSNSDAAQAGIRSFRISTMVEDRQVTMAEVTGVTANNFPGTLHSDANGDLYVVCGSSNSRPIIKISGDSLTEVGRFGSTGNGLTNSTTRFVSSTWLAALDGYLLTGSIFDDVGLINSDTMTYVWGEGETVDESRVRGVVAGAPGEGWILGSGINNYGEIGLYHLTVAGGVSFTKVATFTPDMIQAGAVDFLGEAGGLFYDPTDDSVIMQVQIENPDGSVGEHYTWKYRDGQIVWNVVTPFIMNYEGPFESQNRLHDGRYTFMRASRVIQLDTATGETVTDETLAHIESGAQAYDGLSRTHIVRTTDGWARIRYAP